MSLDIRKLSATIREAISTPVEPVALMGIVTIVATELATRDIAHLGPSVTGGKEYVTLHRADFEMSRAVA